MQFPVYMRFPNKQFGRKRLLCKNMLHNLWFKDQRNIDLIDSTNVSFYHQPIKKSSTISLFLHAAKLTNQKNILHNELVINVQSLCEPPHQLKKKDLFLSQVINKISWCFPLAFFLTFFLFERFLFVFTNLYFLSVFFLLPQKNLESLRLKIAASFIPTIYGVSYGR